MLGYIILAVFVVAGVVVFLKKDEKPNEAKLAKQTEAFRELLKKFDVPEDYYKIVIGQSKVYNVYNCPALIWKDKDKVKTLIMRANPVLTEQDEEDFLFIASQPYLDFKRFDGTYYPDWAAQSKAVQEMFLPYVNLSSTVGGIDYKRQMYWAGTICVYPSSMAEIFTMLGRPITDFKITVDNKKLMRTDGSIPEAMLPQLKKEKEEERPESESTAEMEKAIQTIRASERKAGEEQINRLYAALLAQKRYEDVERATTDEAYRQQLLREAGLSD
jgi:hypothetical protein